MKCLVVFQCGVLRFCGFDVLAPNILFGVEGPPKPETTDKIAHFSKRLETIFDETPIKFYLKTDFEPADPSKHMTGLVLKQSIQDGAGAHGPTVGQHCGKPLPPHQQLVAPK